MSKFTAGNSRAAKLSNEQVLEMRSLYTTEGWTQGTLARKFGVSVNTVGAIVRGETRQNVPMPVRPEDIVKSLQRLEESQGAKVLDKLRQDVAAVPELRASRNLKKLTDPKGAEKFGVTDKGD